MKFSQEMINKLSALAENKVRIVVKGKNSFGQPFETDGFIKSGFVFSDAEKKQIPAYIAENGFAMYMGQKMTNSQGEEFDLHLTIHADADENDLYDELLYVETISEKETGKQVFVNEDFEEIIGRSLEVWSEDEMNARLQEPLPEEVAKLTSLIGRPVVNLNANPGDVDQYGVVKSVTMSSNLPYVDLTTGYLFIGVPLFNLNQIILDEQAMKNLDEYGKTESQPAQE